MPETKDDKAIRLQRIFSFVDWYVDNCRHEREEEGVSDEYLNIRAKFLQLIPDPFSVSFYSRRWGSTNMLWCNWASSSSHEGYRDWVRNKLQKLCHYVQIFIANTFFFPFMSTVVHIPVHKRKDSLPTTRWREVNKVQQGQAILQQRRHSQNNDPVFLDTINISWMPIFNLFIYMPIYSLFVVICYLFMVYSFHKA